MVSVDRILTLDLRRRWLSRKGFGWLKQTGQLRPVKLLEKVDCGEKDAQNPALPPGEFRRQRSAA